MRISIVIVMIMLLNAGCFDREDLYLNANQEVPMPEISVKYNTDDIFPEEIIIIEPDAGNLFGTFFVFKLENRGDAELILTGSPFVILSGIEEDRYSIVQPAGASIAPGGQETFTFMLNTALVSGAQAVINIYNNDNDEGNFCFSMVGGS